MMSERRKHGIDWRYALIDGIMCRCGKSFHPDRKDFRKHLAEHGDDGPITI